MSKYYTDGNNKGSYDILENENNGTIKFVAEVANLEISENIANHLNSDYKLSDENSTKNYLDAFPDFDHTPAMETGTNDPWYGDSTWEDTAYSNDICPNFSSDDLIKGSTVKIWTDYLDTTKREIPDTETYIIQSYNKDDDFIELLYSTNEINEVYKWILKQEDKNEAERRKIEGEPVIKNDEPEIKNKRSATLNDMKLSRKLCINLYDAMDGNEPDLDGKCGFTYFNNNYYIVLTDTGYFWTISSNTDTKFITLEECEAWLWSSFICSEYLKIDMPFSKVELLEIEFKEFCDNNNFKQLSADDILMDVLNNKISVTKWRINYLTDFVNRWNDEIEL